METKKKFFVKYKAEIKAYLMMAIPLLWWGLFFVTAFFMALYFSFTDMRFNIGTITKFTLDNYSRLFNASSPLFDKTFWSAFGTTGIWTVVMMVGNNFMGLFMAFLLMKVTKGRKVFLALLYWPALISAVVGADIIKMIFSSQENGLANTILRIFNLPYIKWFENQNFALLGLMIHPFFLGFSSKLLIYYSAMLAVPSSYYEAASLETSSSVKVFLRITLPLIKNALMINFLLSLIDGLKILGPMQLITEGGPINATNSVILHIYNMAFESRKMGVASAYSFIVFIVILVFSLLQMTMSGKGAAEYD